MLGLLGRLSVLIRVGKVGEGIYIRLDIIYLKSPIFCGEKGSPPDLAADSKNIDRQNKIKNTMESVYRHT